MKATPYLEQVYQLVFTLLNDQGHTELAAQVSDIYELPDWVKANNPLLKKGLIKIVKDYVRGNEKLLKYYENRSEPQQDKQVASRTRKRSADHVLKSVSPKLEVKVRTHKNKPESPLITKVASPKQAAQAKGNSGWMAKFDRPKTLEQLNVVDEPKHKIEEEEIVQVQKKSSKKQKVKAKVESSQYESEEDSFELEPKKKLKKEAKQQKKEDKKKEKKSKKAAKQAKESEQEEEEAEAEEPKIVAPKKKQQSQPIIKKAAAQQEYNNSAYPTEVDNRPKKTFSRINVDQVGPIRAQLRDNSFQAKAKFGQQADHWGQFGYDKLKDTRGESFKKTKGKLKNRAFQGALMDINKINSIPIL